MPWIGVECELEAYELVKFADLLDRSGGGRVAEFLRRCSKLVSGESLASVDRVREIEYRAANAIEKLRSEASQKATAILTKFMGEGVDLESVMSAAGMDGWRAGSASLKNGGTARRKRVFGRGRAVAGADGSPVAIAEKGKPAVSVAETVGRDRRYGESYEGWCSVELRKMGFKMSHVARAMDMDVTECWRYVSGFTKHWRRQGLSGILFPGPSDEWKRRFETAVELAKGTGIRGPKVTLNGTTDCGYGPEKDESHE